MPRLRATPRATQNLADGGVIVRLPPEPIEPKPVIYGSSAVEIAHTSSSIVVPQQVQVQMRQEDMRRAQEIEEQLADDEDPVAALKASEKRAKDRARALEQDAAQVRQWGQQQAEYAARAVSAVGEAQLDTLNNALAAAEAEAEAAEAAMIDAKTRADFAGEVRAQRALMKAEGRIGTLQAGKDELEQQVKRRPQVPQPPAPTGGNVEAVLASLTQLIPEEKDWIRSHPEVLGADKQKTLSAAYNLAQARGITRGSPEYFSFFNEQFGFKDGGAIEDPEIEEEEPMQAVRETRRVAAPPSRSPAGSARLKPGEIMLTPQEREAARWSGVDEVTYARGLQRLRDMKGQGYYN